MDEDKTGQLLIEEIQKDYKLHNKNKNIDVNLIKDFFKGVEILTNRSGLPVGIGQPVYIRTKNYEYEKEIEEINKIVKNIVEKDNEIFQSIYAFQNIF